MKFCTNCGTKIEGTIFFCKQCGTQVGAQPLRGPSTHNRANRIHRNIIIAGLASIIVIGFALFLILRDSTGLVGTWEARERTRHGEEQWLITFNRNGTGSMVIILNGVLDAQESFSWEVMNDRQLLLTSHDSVWRPEIIEFSVSGNALVLDGEIFMRR